MKVVNNRLNSCTGKAWLDACVVAGKRPLGFSKVALLLVFVAVFIYLKKYVF